MPLLEKSNQNLASANFLLEKKMFASSVHCAYYSCVQRMLNVLYEFIGQDKEELKRKCELNATGSHVIVANTVKSELFSISSNMSENQYFSNQIGNLKRNREAADYGKVIIEFPKCKASIEIALKINNILDKNFK